MNPAHIDSDTASVFCGKCFEKNEFLKNMKKHFDLDMNFDLERG